MVRKDWRKSIFNGWERRGWVDINYWKRRWGRERGGRRENICREKKRVFSSHSLYVQGGWGPLPLPLFIHLRSHSNSLV